MTRLEGFLTRCFCFRFAGDVVLRPAGTVFFGVRTRVLRGVMFDRVFFRDFKAPLMPAWAINNVFLMFLKSLSSVSTAMLHHATTACLPLALNMRRQGEPA